MKVSELFKVVEPGCIALTSSPPGSQGILGKGIRFFQYIEDGESSNFGHALIFAHEHGSMDFKADGRIHESVLRISTNHISRYIGSEVLVLKNKFMTSDAFWMGIEEVFDSLGKIYPFHHLLFQAVDCFHAGFFRWAFRYRVKFRFSKLLVLDWPVCSELNAQFLHAAKVPTGLVKKGWRGVNPDDFDDARKNHPEIWEVLAHDILEEG